jgi:hypothetical protein
LSDDDILREAKDAFVLAADAEAENRREALDDIRFARLGEQWPERVRRDRELEGRPCLTINRLPSFIRQVVNDARQNKPAIAVHPVDDAADPQTAEVFSGLIRHIEQSSDAEVASTQQIVAMLQGLPISLFTGEQKNQTENKVGVEKTIGANFSASSPPTK